VLIYSSSERAELRRRSTGSPGASSGREPSREMPTTLTSLIASHGYWVVATVVGLESMGIPVPGETTLVTAAIYAGTTHHLSIGLVSAAAAAGAIIGDNGGYWLGRGFGYRVLLRYAPVLRIGAPRIKLGQYLFHRHGGKVVFFGRFVAVLRALAALLAGINRMPWWRFLFFNAVGGLVWAVAYGLGAYEAGEYVVRLKRPVAVAGLVVACGAAVAGFWFLRRHEAELQAKAEAALPGPLRARGR
jgi:membrane protein DedA with SNARE-associated domain